MKSTGQIQRIAISLPLAFAISLELVLAGCGGETSTPTPTPVSPTNTIPPAAPTDTPVIISAPTDTPVPPEVLTATPAPPTSTPLPEATATTAPPVTFIERVAGSYSFTSWAETPGTVTSGLHIAHGTLKVDTTGGAEWELYFSGSSPEPRLRCVGRIPLSTERLEGVPGSGNDVKDWPGSVPPEEHEAYFGWAIYTDRGMVSDPFSLVAEVQSSGQILLEMRNGKGTFSWVKATP